MKRYYVSVSHWGLFEVSQRDYYIALELGRNVCCAED